MSYIRAAANEGTPGDHGRDDARRASQVRARREPNRPSMRVSSRGPTARIASRPWCAIRTRPTSTGRSPTMGSPPRARASASPGSTAGATCASTTRRGATSTARTRTTTSTSASTGTIASTSSMIRRPSSSMHVEIGMKSHEGFFQPIARSGRADFPRSGPSPNTHLEWMTVTSADPPPCVAPYRSRYSGPEPPLPGREGAGYVDVWRAGYAPSMRAEHAGEEAHLVDHFFDAHEDVRAPRRSHRAVVAPRRVARRVARRPAFLPLGALRSEARRRGAPRRDAGAHRRSRTAR